MKLNGKYKSARLKQERESKRVYSVQSESKVTHYGRESHLFVILFHIYFILFLFSKMAKTLIWKVFQYGCIELLNANK